MTPLIEKLQPTSERIVSHEVNRGVENNKRIFEI
jgi:hypothetical protein